MSELFDARRAAESARRDVAKHKAKLSRMSLRLIADPTRTMAGKFVLFAMRKVSYQLRWAKDRLRVADARITTELMRPDVEEIERRRRDEANRD